MELPQQITYLDGCGQEDDGTPDSCMEDDKDGDEGNEEEGEAGPSEGFEEEEEEEGDEDEDEDESGSELGEGEEEVGLSYLMGEEIQDEDYAGERKEER